MGQIYWLWIQIQPTTLLAERKESILEIFWTYEHCSCALLFGTLNLKYIFRLGGQNGSNLLVVGSNPGYYSTSTRKEDHLGIFSSHIIIAVATSLTVLARLLDGKLSYIKAKWVTMSGVQTPAKTLINFFSSTVYGTGFKPNWNPTCLFVCT